MKEENTTYEAAPMPRLKELAKKAKFSLTGLACELWPDKNTNSPGEWLKEDKILAYQQINRFTTIGNKQALRIAFDDLKKMKELLNCSYDDLIG